MEGLQIFNYESNQVRTVLIDGEPWFVAKDVCDVLEHSNSRTALDRLDADEKGVSTVYTLGGNQQMAVINESGVYSLVFTSRVSKAKSFKRWITRDVIPLIRKTGSYGTPRELSRLDLIELARESELARLLVEKEKAEVEYQLRLQEPKVALYDVAMQADNAQPIGTVAKTLNTGPNKLFAFLRERKILISHGAKYNLPYQEYIDRGYFTVRQYTVTHFTQGIENKSQTLVTAKGMAFIHRLLEQSKELVTV